MYSPMKTMLKHSAVLIALGFAFDEYMKHHITKLREKEAIERKEKLDYQIKQIKNSK